MPQTCAPPHETTTVAAGPSPQLRTHRMVYHTAGACLKPRRTHAVPCAIYTPSPKDPFPDKVTRRATAPTHRTIYHTVGIRKQGGSYLFPPPLYSGGNKSASSRWPIAKNNSGAAPWASVKRPDCTPCDREPRLVLPRHHNSNPYPVAHVRPGSSAGGKKPTKILPQLRRASSDGHPCGA